MIKMFRTYSCVDIIDYKLAAVKKKTEAKDYRART